MPTARTSRRTCRAWWQLTRPGPGRSSSPSAPRGRRDSLPSLVRGLPPGAPAPHREAHLVRELQHRARAPVAAAGALSELWNHYPSAIIKARIPFTAIPLPRGPRLGGRSQMSLTSLVLHGLGAIFGPRGRDRCPGPPGDAAGNPGLSGRHRDRRPHPFRDRSRDSRVGLGGGRAPGRDPPAGGPALARVRLRHPQQPQLFGRDPASRLRGLPRGRDAAHP